MLLWFLAHFTLPGLRMRTGCHTIIHTSAAKELRMPAEHTLQYVVADILLHR